MAEDGQAVCNFLHLWERRVERTTRRSRLLIACRRSGRCGGSRLAWRWYRIDSGAAVAGGVHGAYAEDDIVLGEGQRDGGIGTGGDDVSPVRLSGVAIDDLEGGSCGEACGSLPAENSACVVGRVEHSDLLGLAGRCGERGESGGIETGDVGDVVEIVELDVVDILDAVLDAWGLVLMVEVFEPFRETDGGETFLGEAGMVTAAARSGPRRKIMTGWNAGTMRMGHVVGLAGWGSGGEAFGGGVEVGAVDVDDGAGEFAGGRVVLGADGLDLAELLERGGAGDALREDTYSRFICAHCAGSRVASDDVVVEDGFEIQPSDLANLAKWRLPSRPCSSPATVRKTMVLGNLSFERTRALSMETAVPLARRRWRRGLGREC